VHGKLARRGVVPYRTRRVHRFAVERRGFGRRQPTVRVADGQPGVECQIDFGRLGLVPDPATGRQRVTHGLIFTATWLAAPDWSGVTFTQTLAAVIAGCEAAWGVLRWGVSRAGSGQHVGASSGSRENTSITNAVYVHHS
jgi:hypothetical protein